MNRLPTPLFLMAVMAALLCACVNSSQIIATGLEIELTAIEQSGDGTVTAAWHVKNPNVVSYLFSRVNHKILLNGVLIGSIDEAEALAIPASSDTARTSKVVGGTAAAARAIADAANVGSAQYRVDSQITILVYDDSIEKSALSHSGTVPVKAK